MTTIRIVQLDEGCIVEDHRGPRVWRAAAVTLADAQALADHRLNPRGPPPPPGPTLPCSGYAEPHPLAVMQYGQATGEEPCVAGICSVD